MVLNNMVHKVSKQEIEYAQGLNNPDIVEFSDQKLIEELEKVRNKKEDVRTEMDDITIREMEIEELLEKRTGSKW